MISRREFEMYLELVRRSEIHQTIEAALRAGTGGAPRQLAVDVFLTGALLTATHKRTGVLTRVRETLVKDLADQTKAAYNIRDKAGRDVTMRQLYYLVDRIANLYEYQEARCEKDVTVTERARRQGEFESILDRLVSSTSMHLPSEGSYAIDGSAIRSAARRKGSNKQLKAANEEPGPRRQFCADMDARTGHQTETYDNGSDNYFGFALVAFTRAGTVGTNSPTLVDHMRLVPANSRGLTETMEVIEGRSQTGNPITEVLADRAFTTSTIDTWAKPLYDLGVKQVQDMHPSDGGARPDAARGYVLIDGWPHAVGIPEHLIHITPPPKASLPRLRKAATRVEKAEHAAAAFALERFRELIAERRTWAFEPLGAQTSAGSRRYISPARAGKRRCAGYADSLYLDADTPECVHPPGQPVPKACRQATITVPFKFGLKLRQEHYWGSDEWLASYARRSRVESTFGLLKSPNGGGVKRGWTGLTGLIRTAFMLAIQVAACNLRTLLRWARATGFDADPLVRVNLDDYGFLELGADGHPLPFDGDPPGAAAAAA
ncbi:hypothetical protein [Aeromicrobium sp. Leaf272]|uniref:hypothetical protein n=1 Tax=Aeromicrobium sp. Leaf272 TaxID=1736317 RepID=UPI000A903D38|nr:hypothetical protein [Aeromicrobium sp. Leaf272]